MKLGSFKYCFTLLFLLWSTAAFSQGQNKKWYFGQTAGLDFMTSPPTPITGLMTTQEGCASVADAAGNLLFYTDGLTVWNAASSIMSNGNGLMGNGSTTQAAVIVKQPGNSNIYFVFTNDDVGGVDGLRYSTIDMNLSSGQGSVTVQNVFIVNGLTEKLTSVRHCNGTDIWVMVHDNFANNFRAFLVSAVGVNTTAVVSSVGPNSVGTVGYMKFSPNGKKVALATYASSVVVCDFDASTGLVSNPLNLTCTSSYGCEFSADGTKIYSGSIGKIYQWDLCAGSGTAIAASLYTVSSTGVYGLQLATDGKIYASRYLTSTLGIINSPNLAGSSCNYVDLGLSISPNVCRLGLPNFITSGFSPPPTPFTHTVSNSFGCQTASYTAPPVVNNFSLTNCSASGYSLNSMMWIFGDPASGSANTSTLANPSHAFTSLGTFTTSLILYYTCGGGTDTIKQQVVINQPCISVTSTSITCANLGSATVQATGGVGPYSYTWMPTAQASSVATGLSPGTYTLTVFDFGNNFTYTATATFNSLIPLTGNLVNSPSVSCNGATTGTAVIANITGGSGTQNYLWTNGLTSYTAANPQNLTAGNYTYTVTDGLTGCIINGGFFISQPPAINLSIAAASPSACAGTGIALTGTASGGVPIPIGNGYNYSWTAGPASFSQTPVIVIAGNYVYSLTATDSKNCVATATVALNIVAIPTISVSNPLICPLQTGTLVAFGANIYTWSNLSTGNSLSDNPLVTTVYTVTGETLGCAATKTAAIILKSVPVPTLTTNGVNRCNGSSLSLNGSGGVSYQWSGPSFYSSSLQNPVINPVGPGNAGLYNLIVTAANGCTASATSASVVIHPTPTVSALGSTVCIGQTFSISANSVAGATYSWTGPLGYTSANQNNTVVNLVSGQSGSYVVKVTSINGCTNTANAGVSIIPSPETAISVNGSSICAQALSGSPNVLSVTNTGAASFTITAPPFISIANPNASFSNLTTIAPFTPGVVTVTLAGSNGVCTVTNSASFTVVPNPAITLSAIAPVICQGQTFTYSVQGAANYLWSSAGPPILTYSAGAMAIVNPTLTSLFSVYGTSVGCNSATQSSMLSVNPLPVILPVTSGATICLNSSTPLIVGGTATSYSWSPATGLNTTTGATVIAGPLTQQNYIITAALNSCTSSVMLMVFVQPLPVPEVSFSSPAACLNETISAQGNGGLEYLWADPAGGQKTGPVVNFIMDNVAKAGDYRLTVTDKAGCKGTITFPLTVIDLPKGYLTGSTMKACVPFCSDFSFLSFNAVSTNWKVSTSTFTGSAFKYCFGIPGDYRITGDMLDTVTGCRNTQEFVVNAWPSPVADYEFYPGKPVEQLDEVIFTNTSKGESQNKWSWYFIKNGGDHSGNQNTSYLYQEAGTYPVAMVVTNVLGCADTITKVITVEPDFNVYVPNAFTPNADGLNELFKPVMRSAKSFSFVIFNRWGEKLFETSDFDGGWDGRFKGQLCKPDIYVWKLHVVADNNATLKTGQQQRDMMGEVTLYR